MGLYEDILDKKEKICVIGMGYVGMPLSVAFAQKLDVIGFDINDNKINEYKQGIDPTNEVGDERIGNTSVLFTSDEKEIKSGKFIIIAVPTPINIDKTPNLDPVIEASKLVGRNLTKGAVVVYESTVYPGVTEDVCIPVLASYSKLAYGKDFTVGYSPERINPGDPVHRLETIKKIVSGTDTVTVEIIKRVYELIIEAGVHVVSSIKTAEATKVVENSQRDINIAFMNELALVFDRMNINTLEVIEAMNTKWNALKFYPGLVGGHCIGVDPYYFIYEAEKLGYHSQIILSGRIINDSMSRFIADKIIKQLILTGKTVKNAKVYILGLTFKENCPDTRNTKIIDIINYLKEFEIHPFVVDPIAKEEETKEEYGIELTKLEDINNADCIVVAVAHNIFKNLTKNKIDEMYIKTNESINVFIDVKGIFKRDEFINAGYSYWSL
jgi:UDP-N-acetyl-D-galactosamine dehydrogenase